MENILKLVKSDEESGLLIEKSYKEQKGGFLSVSLGTLGASLLGNVLASKGVLRVGEGTIEVGYASKRSSFKKKIDSTRSFNKL